MDKPISKHKLKIGIFALESFENKEKTIYLSDGINHQALEIDDAINIITFLVKAFEIKPHRELK